MSLMWNCVLIIIALVIVRISRWWWQWSNPNSKCNGKLPPGSMGFPIIGETIELFKPCGMLEIPPFFQKRMLKYGSLFRTNLFGFNTVILTDPEVIYEVFRQENHSFVLSPPDLLVRVLGDNLFLKTGDIHKYLKQTTMHFIGSEGLKRNMIGTMNQAIREHLRSKASKGTFGLKDLVSSLIVSYMTPKLISNLKPETQTKLINHLKVINVEWFQKILVPSTWKIVFKILRARKEATKIMKEALERRIESGEKQGDFLDTLLEDMEKEGSIFDQDSAISLLLILGFTSKVAAVACAMAVNFISKNPKVLAELKREHEEILEKRDDKEAGFSWDEYRYKMTFTGMVINESLRLSNMASVLFRKAVRDVEIKGYMIPAGWMMLVSPSVVHYNSEIYENPFEFNPWRWKGKDARSPSKTFMVFGGGLRQCVGADLARLQVTVLLHHLVTTYDFSVVQECELKRTPFPCLTKELLVNISPKSTK